MAFIDIVIIAHVVYCFLDIALAADFSPVPLKIYV